ncbi:LOW QUALITY PROTEIN: chloride channel protein ClC-Kb-like [Rhinatrema bivittatum]|uniref:LOW QUALITY PROTEIN: chloride channel protein ClC-Kb-like n=1 Tax=Rhinatrema bivittatum TaxID=194408 RepID=UPI00112E25A3|nr:LOW QUALITY PROTEIN: chloride channel protein ClC-Kb-like [Rhinatrema bivittatum]
MGLTKSEKRAPPQEEQMLGDPLAREVRLNSQAESELTEGDLGDQYFPKENESVSLKIENPPFTQSTAISLSIRNQIIKFGEDWIFLFLLGISMAIISFGLDVTISKFQRANLWVYDVLEDYRYLQYFSWVLYHVLLMMVSAGVAKYISPQAAGSGIPELKVTLRGVVLAEFFTFRTFIAKLIGVICTLAAGSTIFLGKVGPFVHMATILATLLGKIMVKFAGTKENPSRKYEMLIAGAAVGVACCFVAPVGGVLFSVEATATHFAVRNYWRGFFAATCAALMFRLLAVVNQERETVAVLFHTKWSVEFPFDLPEYLSYAILGFICGCLCCLYLFCHRNMLIFLQKHKRINKFMMNYQILYAGFVALVLASITFPHGLGQYIGSRLSMKEHLETFFNNLTYGIEELAAQNTTGSPPYPTYQENWLQWTHPYLSSLEMFIFFTIMKFFMLLFATSMIVPAGYFLPVFVYGAGLGRLYGEIMAKIFPEGIISEGLHIKITPAGYALAGAAAYSGAVTHTISTAVLVFELTGQMSHILPVLIAVLIANAISQRSQPSFFDGIVIVKKLPYLPKLTVGKTRAHDIYAEDFMVTDLKYLVKGFKYKDIRILLKVSNLRQFPLVDSEDSKILLGSVKRKHLAKLLSQQLSSERRLQYLLSQSADNSEGTTDLSILNKNWTSESDNTESLVPGDRTKSSEDTVTLECGEQTRSFQGGRRRKSSKKRFQYYTMMEEWECQQLQEIIRMEDLIIDPEPYRLMEKETLYECYDLFNLLGLRTAYVTSIGRLVGVVSLNELKDVVNHSVKGTFTRRSPPHDNEAHDSEEAKTSFTLQASRILESAP